MTVGLTFSFCKETCKSSQDQAASLLLPLPEWRDEKRSLLSVLDTCRIYWLMVLETHGLTFPVDSIRCLLHRMHAFIFLSFAAGWDNGDTYLGSSVIRTLKTSVCME